MMQCKAERKHLLQDSVDAHGTDLHTMHAHLQDPSGVLIVGAMSDRLSAVPDGFKRPLLARDPPCTEDQPRMLSTSLP